MGEILKGIADTGLGEDDVADVESTAKTLLEEVVKPRPDKGVLKRSITMLKRFLTPLAVGAQDGAVDAVQNSAHDWSVAGIKGLVALSPLLL